MPRIYQRTFAFLLAFLLIILHPSLTFAWKPITHLYLASELAEDALDDGKVTIFMPDYETGSILGEWGQYEVDENMLDLMDRFRETFYCGNFGPDAYPDILTGGAIIHTDVKSIGLDTNDWLEHLWKHGYEKGESQHVQAWVLGYMGHAAGDLFIHTFLNHFAGGGFELGDNAARHVIFEGYIAKRQPGNKDYQVELPLLVKDFIIKYMIDAKGGSDLDRFFPLKGKAYLSFPRVYSSIRNSLLDHAGLNMDSTLSIAKTAYLYRWAEDITKGLEAWIDLSHNLALTIFLDEKIITTELKKKSKDDPSFMEYVFKGTKTRPELSRVDRSYYLFKEFKDHYLSYMSYKPDFQADIERYLSRYELTYEENMYKAIFKGGLDFLALVTWGVPFKYYMEYVKRPEYYFDKFLSKPPFAPNIQPKRQWIDIMLSYYTAKQLGKEFDPYEPFWQLIPEDYYDNFANTDAKPVTLKEANRKYLKIAEDGYNKPELRWSWRSFPPAFNTLQMLKLMVLKKDELKRLVNDMAEKIEKKHRTSIDQFPEKNVMLGWCESIDESNMWKKGAHQMFLAGTPLKDKYWSGLFMKMTGEDPVSDPFKYNPPAPPGAVLSSMSLAPEYLSDYRKEKSDQDLKKFDPKAFREWFWETVKKKSGSATRNMEYTKGETLQQKVIYRENAPDPDLEVTFKETFQGDAGKAQRVKAGEDVTLDMEYLLWGFDEDEKEVEVRVEGNTDDGGAVMVPVKSKVPFTLTDALKSEKAELTFAAQYPTKEDEARGVGVDIYLDNYLYSTVWFKDVYTVEGPGTDFNGLGNLTVKVKYEMDNFKDDSGMTVTPQIKVTLKPLADQEKKLKDLKGQADALQDPSKPRWAEADSNDDQGNGAMGSTPLIQTDRKKIFRFERIPLGPYNVVAEVVPEKDEPPDETSPAPPDAPDDGLKDIPPGIIVGKVFSLMVTPAYAETLQAKGPKHGETTVTLYNEKPVDPKEAFTRTTNELPGFEVEVELGKINRDDLFDDINRSASWRVLLNVTDEEGRPVSGAQVLCGQLVNAKPESLGEGRFMIGPFNTKDTKEAHITASVQDRSAVSHETKVRRGETRAVYNGTSQVNETIVIKGLKQPKLTNSKKNIHPDDKPEWAKNNDPHDNSDTSSGSLPDPEQEPRPKPNWKPRTPPKAPPQDESWSPLPDDEEDQKDDDSGPPPKAGNGRPTLFGETFDYELENSPKEEPSGSPPSGPSDPDIWNWEFESPKKEPVKDPFDEDFNYEDSWNG